MISNKVNENLKNSSWIRAMFEEGEKLRKIYGPDKVFDFTLGNPDPAPPQSVKDALKSTILKDDPNLHKYMNNLGFDDVRRKVAYQLAIDSGVPLTESNIAMTCGAAGGLNVVLKTILNPSDEVIIFAPYFVEYLFYVDNHGGKPVIVPTDFNSFEPDLEALKDSITPRTKALIINSPNNPTGVIYSNEKLTELSNLLKAKENEFGTKILVISDEPYNKIVYDNVKVPSILKIFKNSIIVNSFSKSLALPGERIGYIAANPLIDNVALLMEGFKFTNRILGFVNAPALFQKVIAETIDEVVDVNIYKERRDILYNFLIKLGFTCVKPQGAFYLFPKSLIPDDIEFIKRATAYNLLLVPGKGFGCPGYFRISYCVNAETIENSLTAFEALANEFK